MNKLLINFIYFITGYILLILLSIFLLDIIWIKRAKFYLLDYKINSGFKGIYKSLKLAFSHELESIIIYHGIDMYLYIYMLK